LSQQIKDLEEKYNKEILSKDDLTEKLGQLEKQRTEIETNIAKDEDEIRAKLADLKSIKEWIENRLKKVNEEKLVLKEVEDNESQIKQLEDSKRKINEGIKSLDQKLANLKQ
jgi:hypothetical protein